MVRLGFVVVRGPTEATRLEHCREKLAAIKVPAAIVMIDAILLNANARSIGVRWPRSGNGTSVRVVESGWIFPRAFVVRGMPRARAIALHFDVVVSRR